MGRADISAAIGRSADDDRAIDPAAAHVADAAGIIDDLVESHVSEAPEHELHHRTKAEHGGADAHADEAGLADGRIDQPLVAILGPRGPR